MLRTLCLSLFVATSACAQTADTPATAADVQTTPTDPDPTVPTSALSPAEEAVQATIARDGVHVVHFWAPWCDNSTAELGAGWYEVVERHPDVSFTFVTVWNDGEIGEDALTRYAIPASVERLVVDGPRPLRADRRTTFLGMPVSWIPTTWVFNRNGELATAFNYGEATPEQLDAAIDGAASDWPHE
jgi:thiol-disulfide isomerase/thioredoxin